MLNNRTDNTDGIDAVAGKIFGKLWILREEALGGTKDLVNFFSGDHLFGGARRRRGFVFDFDKN